MLLVPIKYTEKINYNLYNNYITYFVKNNYKLISKKATFKNQLTKKLLKIEEFINKKYETKLNIFNVITRILNNLYFNESGLNLNTFTIEGLQIETLYRLIRYGNRDCQGISIIDDIIKLSLNLLGIGD